MIRPVAARSPACPHTGSRLAGLLAALTLAVAGAAVPVSPAGAVPASAAPAGPVVGAEEADEAPLEVTIDSLSPSTIPAKGQITVTGKIRNRSQMSWTDLSVYLFSSRSPMTTSEQVAEAAATEPTAEVGERLTDPGLYQKIEQLAPGATTGYMVSVPAGALNVQEEGVYWLGVHVLGTQDGVRTAGADGRARTFIASMKASRPQTTMALVMPVKALVRRDADGRLSDVAAWRRMLGPDGRLGRLLGISGTAAGPGLTWVVDPAVLDAARSLEAGNPGFQIGPTDTPAATPGASPSAEGSASPSAGTSPAEVENDAGAVDDPPVSAESLAEAERTVREAGQVASAWLAEAVDQAGERAVMHVPYGDPDTAAAVRWKADDLRDAATALGTATMRRLGVSSAPVVAPASGRFPAEGLESLDPDAPLLLAEEAVDAEQATGAAVLDLGDGHTAALSSSAARIGGPAPTAPYDALALRQRILAEAAVHAIGPDRTTPLVVDTPDQWDPGAGWRSAAFFSGLEVPWLEGTSLPSVLAAARPTPYDQGLVYPPSERNRELPAANIAATQELISAGSVLANLLTRNDTVDEQVAKSALLGSSSTARRRPNRAAVQTRQISQEVHRLLEKVSVQASPLVTMSSGKGSFAVTVINRLAQPVTVGLEVDTGTPDVAIPAPDLVALGPGQRASVRLTVTATGTGVHSVQITPTSRDGRSLGNSTRVKVRSSQVGLVIWLIMGGGAALFVIAIAVSILRRVRKRRSTRATPSEDPTS